MQLLDHVREFRADEAHLEPEHLTVARDALAREIVGAQKHPARARRGLSLGLGLGLGLGGLSTAAVGTVAVVAIVAGGVVAPPPGSVSTASAAEVLQKAADSVLAHVSAADAPLAAGQYLRIETTRDAVWSDGSSSDVPAESAAFATHNVTVLYVPADRSDDWIRETKPEEITGIYGPDGEAFLASVKAEPSQAETGVEAIPAGVETFGDVTQPIDMYRDSYGDMPRDPDALLAWFQAQTPGGYAWLAILNALYQNLPPADLRAAMLGALARIDGLALISEDGHLATIQQVREETTQQFVIDTESGLLVSVVDPRRHPNDIVPAELPDSVQTFTMTIVDSAPTPER